MKKNESMAKARYDAFGVNCLTITFKCKKCGEKNVIRGIEAPDMEEKCHLTHHCQQKGCDEAYSINIVDKLDYGEVDIVALPDENDLEIDNVPFEYKCADLSLLHYIDNLVEWEDVLEAIKILEEKPQQVIHRLLYVKLFSTLDYYIFSMIKQEMKDSDAYKQRYAAYKCPKKKQSLNCFYRDNIKRESFQNINKVTELLSHVFGIHIDADQYSLLQNAVQKRNAIVHKNSFENEEDSKFYHITEEDLLVLKDEIKRFTKDVRERLGKQISIDTIINNNIKNKES